MLIYGNCLNSGVFNAKNKILCFWPYGLNIVRAHTMEHPFVVLHFFALTLMTKASWLCLSAVHIEIQMTRCLDFAKIAGIRMDDINKFCIRCIQFFAEQIGCEKWQRRIQACTIRWL